ncbi:MAG: (d)CMP kinase [Pseudoflavonifractor sp.]|nr:(d)CMP kinase [Pseudoflavonifractor sp.]
MSEKKIIIAIDGYSSSGKSTMAKALAREIGYRYVDSGAMYRAVTLYALRHGMMTDGVVDEAALRAALPSIMIDFKVVDGGQRTMLDGEDVESEIRGMTVSENVSTISAIPFVRHALVKMQQAFGREKGIVMDGRDIGTTVFPGAELKIFVNAPAETRAGRRYKELMDKGVEVTYNEVLANVRHRDHVDETREESPLRKADDAVELDNSDMSVDEQDKWLVAQYREALDKA